MYLIFKNEIKGGNIVVIKVVKGREEENRERDDIHRITQIKS
jgi:hypothetical protein